MSRVIVTYADGGHEELLDVALPTYRAFADRHGYEIVIGEKMTDFPPAWNKIPLLLSTLRDKRISEVVWFDCDLIIVDPSEDFPLISAGKSHSLVRHFEDNSEVPNSGVWRVTKDCIPLLEQMSELQVFRTHGWWEQAALMTLMGYSVPSEGSLFSDTKCQNKYRTTWYENCQFMRLCWNSHPNYRSDRPRIVHCSYPDMTQRIEVMRRLVKDPTFDYPRYDSPCDRCLRSKPKKRVKDDTPDGDD